MPRNDLNVALKGLDDLFSSEETRQEEQREQVQQIPVDELFPFKNHPFKVLDDDAMTRTVESISQFGVLAPLIARPRPEGGYEIISGHRRKHAAELAHLDTVPVIVRNMEDDHPDSSAERSVRLRAAGGFIPPVHTQSLLSLLWITAPIIIGSELQTNIHPSMKGGVLCSF